MIPSHHRSFLLRELQSLATQVTGEEVSVLEGDAGSCWSWNWRERVITVAPEYLGEKAADVCRAVLMHECAHCAITRIQHLMAPERHHLYKDLLNVLEDFRIESWLASVFPGCGPWLATTNDLIFRESAGAPWSRSLQIQFLRGLMEWGHCGRFPEEGPATAVKDALRETRAAVLAQTACHPAAASGRRVAIETLKAQQRMLGMFERDIRPVWERLVALDECAGLSRHTGSAGSGEGAGPRNNAIRSRRRAGGAVGSPRSAGGVLTRTYLERARALSSLVDPLAEEIMRLFETTKRHKTVKGRSQGDRIDLRAAMQAEADPRLGDRVWERKLLNSRFDPLVVLALDCSSSMNGSKFDAAYDATVLLSEVCLRSGLPMALWTFESRARQIIAPHGQGDSDVRRSRIDGLRRACGGSTAMDKALAGIQASAELGQFSNPIVLVVGDGEPDNMAASKSCIQRFQAAKIPLCGIGIGRDTEGMVSLFPEAVAVPDVSAMAKSLAAVLRKTLLDAAP